MFTTFNTSLVQCICSIYLLVLQHFGDQWDKESRSEAQAQHVLCQCAFLSPLLQALVISISNHPTWVLSSAAPNTSSGHLVLAITIFNPLFCPYFSLQFCVSASAVGTSLKLACFRAQSPRMHPLPRLLPHPGPCHGTPGCCTLSSSRHDHRGGRAWGAQPGRQTSKRLC